MKCYEVEIQELGQLMEFYFFTLLFHIVFELFSQFFFVHLIWVFRKMFYFRLCIVKFYLFLLLTFFSIFKDLKVSFFFSSIAILNLDKGLYISLQILILIDFYLIPLVQKYIQQVIFVIYLLKISEYAWCLFIYFSKNDSSEVIFLKWFLK